MSSLPSNLSGSQAQGLVFEKPIAQFEIGPMRNFVYLLIDWKSRGCAIVDPQDDTEPLENAMANQGLALQAIFLTHTHHDHVGGLGPLVAKHPHVPVYLHELDMHRIRETVRKSAKLQYVRDEQKIALGSMSITVLHTPGHSPGECSYFVENSSHDGPPYLFTGDTVFIRDCGRTDFAGGNALDMFDSIQRIKKLPQNTVILCGHHYQPEIASTIAAEMVDSPPFRCRNAAELEALP